MYSLLTPILPTDRNSILTEKAVELIKLAGGLGKNINSTTLDAFYDLMKNMNGYYSNLIEGNKTHPLDIEKALNKVYFRDKNKRRKVEENLAHIKTQNLIKRRYLDEPNLDVTSKEFIKWIHKELYNNLDEEFRYIIHNGHNIEIKPGEFRNRNVKVGNHEAPNYEAIESLMDRFSSNYNEKTTSINQVLQFAASHHRLVYIHPFLDGNGRVARLFSYAFALSIGIDSKGLWSISRGLARTRDKYYAQLSFADQPRQGDLDGRGNLTEKGLFEFCNYFLDSSIDQIKFIDSILDYEYTLKSLHTLVNNKDISNIRKNQYYIILKELFTRGEVEKREFQNLLNLSESSVTKLIKEMLENQLISNGKTNRFIKIKFTISDSVYIFPNLLPNETAEDIKYYRGSKQERKDEFSKDDLEKSFKNYSNKFEVRKTEILGKKEIVKQLPIEKQVEICELIDLMLKSQDYQTIEMAVDRIIEK